MYRYRPQIELAVRPRIGTDQHTVHIEVALVSLLTLPDGASCITSPQIPRGQNLNTLGCRAVFVLQYNIAWLHASSAG